jgi:hypothetical protein
VIGFPLTIELCLNLDRIKASAAVQAGPSPKGQIPACHKDFLSPAICGIVSVMNSELAAFSDQNAPARTDKAAWREREGWCSSAEAEVILSVEKGPLFEIVESEPELVL